jgi:hypothetical protein
MARFIRSSQAAALRPRGTGLGAERWRGIGPGKFVGNGGRRGVTAVYIGASWAPRQRRLRFVTKLSLNSVTINLYKYNILCLLQYIFYYITQFF